MSSEIIPTDVLPPVPSPAEHVDPQDLNQSPDVLPPEPPAERVELREQDIHESPMTDDDDTNGLSPPVQSDKTEGDKTPTEDQCHRGIPPSTTVNMEVDIEPERPKPPSTTVSLSDLPPKPKLKNRQADEVQDTETESSFPVLGSKHTSVTLETDPTLPNEETEMPVSRWMCPDGVSSLFFKDIPLDDQITDLGRRMRTIGLRFKCTYPKMDSIPLSILEFATRAITNDKITEHEGEKKEINFGNFFVALPLVCFKEVVASQDMIIKLGTKGGFKKKVPKLFGQSCPTLHRFWVVHHHGRKAHVLNGSAYAENPVPLKQLRKLESKMIKFFTDQFESMHNEETKSIKDG